MSIASSLSSVAQQLSQAIGVGLAAIALHVTAELHPGVPIAKISVGPAYVAIAVLSLIALSAFLALPHDVAREMSGHRRRRPSP